MFDDDVRDTEPVPTPQGRLRSAALLLDNEDLELVAALAETLVERRRKPSNTTLRGSPRPKLEVHEIRFPGRRRR